MIRSLARDNRTFAGLPLEQALADHGLPPRCGLAIFDLQSGALAHWLTLEGPVRELYDTVVLPGTRRPSALGFRTDEIKQFISIETD